MLKEELEYIAKIGINVTVLRNMLRQGLTIDAYWKADGILDQLNHLAEMIRSQANSESSQSTPSSNESVGSEYS